MSAADDSANASRDATDRQLDAAVAPASAAAGSDEISALKQKVMTAVRSAITESLLDRDGAAPLILPPVDLDFSMPATDSAPLQPKPPLESLATRPVGNDDYRRLAPPTVPVAGGHTHEAVRLESRRPAALQRPPEGPVSAVANSRQGMPRWLVPSVGLIAGLVLSISVAAVVRPELRSIVWAEPDQPVSKPEFKPASGPAAKPVTVPQKVAAQPIRLPPGPVPEQPTAPQGPSTPVDVATVRPPDAPAPAPPLQPATPAAPATATPLEATNRFSLRDSQTLLAKGSVKAARAMLERLAAAPGPDAADVAFALARSYDRNFLESLSTADAAGDRANAERWYRRWHELSIKAGTVSNGVTLDRLLRTLR
jgi:hypothetical protein